MYHALMSVILLYINSKEKLCYQQLKEIYFIALIRDSYPNTLQIPCIVPYNYCIRADIILIYVGKLHIDTIK